MNRPPADAPPSLSIDHLQIAMPKGEEAAGRAFFSRLLGLVELEKPAELSARGGVWFACGSQQIHLGVEEDFRPARKAHVAFRLENPNALEGLAARLERAGVEIRRDRALPGAVRFFVDDPWGNRLEFLAPELGASPT